MALVKSPVCKGWKDEAAVDFRAVTTGQSEKKNQFVGTVFKSSE